MYSGSTKQLAVFLTTDIRKIHVDNEYTKMIRIFVRDL
ncbi:MAG: hypothetical protein UX02_C0001G0018 [Candidatus Moranbacteria bacterium GW2011_GWC1_45_18]|nr:MAG: hypothetical protein UT79_C0002G0379 [Candidatus Moranbacteria bacterium GW2011_GWC2_40_12]KKT34220.1 MAG: hypothetical protein UW19_C0001G0115 [Candidatus Moranbacteria bacterium GW2011_GWF2_44_10]KKU00570.1 MAG: hypothetical protein UX02_C0001G0018 [Candidatus Moranbacteria bacterium GW2011_GWC1_45_18]